MVPVLTFYVGIWLLLFALLRAGRVLRFVSTSVMGGFISGICCTIILMQLPKLMGGHRRAPVSCRSWCGIWSGCRSIPCLWGWGRRCW